MIVCKKLRLTAVAALASAGFSFAPSAWAGAGWNEAAFLQEKAELLMARATGAQAQASAIAARDASALSSAECAAIDTSAKTAAVAYYERGQPVSPQNVIQNSTCFLDIAAMRIPVSLTGIGFLDGMLNSFLSKIATSACSQGMSYVNGLKNSAISQIRSGVSGAINIPQLNAVGINANQLITNSVTGAASRVVNTTTTYGTNTINNAATGVINSPSASTSIMGNGSGNTSTSIYQPQASGTTSGF